MNVIMCVCVYETATQRVLSEHNSEQFSSVPTEVETLRKISRRTWMNGNANNAKMGDHFNWIFALMKCRRSSSILLFLFFSSEQIIILQIIMGYPIKCNESTGWFVTVCLTSWIHCEKGFHRFDFNPNMIFFSRILSEDRHGPFT